MTEADRERYSRQILFPGIGAEGQQHLLAAHAAIVGCGALGSFHAAALARSGVGRLTIIDRDVIESSNLHRQFLFEEEDAVQALPKAVAAQRRIARINSAVEIRAAVDDLTASNVSDLLAGADLILDGTDNFETRYLINDFAVRENIPWIYGAAVGSYGLSMPIVPLRTACLRCVYPAPPSAAQPTCETAGVLNAIISAVASIQVADALKILAGHAGSLRPRITTIDVWEGMIRQVAQPERAPDCLACARREFPALEETVRATARLCGRNAIQIAGDRRIDLAELRDRLSLLGATSANEFALRFSAGGHLLTVFADGRAIVQGTDDPALARSLYARYIG